MWPKKIIETEIHCTNDQQVYIKGLLSDNIMTANIGRFWNFHWKILCIGNLEHRFTSRPIVNTHNRAQGRTK